MLLNSLLDFRDRVNENAKLKTFLKGWEPVISILTSDTGEAYSLVVKNETVTQVLLENMDHNHKIDVEGDETTLDQVFSGNLNPAEALLDGQLAIYGNEKDQLKLDAIALIIWGM